MVQVLAGRRRCRQGEQSLLPAAAMWLLHLQVVVVTAAVAEGRCRLQVVGGQLVPVGRLLAVGQLVGPRLRFLLVVVGQYQCRLVVKG